MRGRTLVLGLLVLALPAGGLAAWTGASSTPSATAMTNATAPRGPGATAATPGGAEATSPVPAVQSYAALGLAKCRDCHEEDGRHEAEVDWYENRDGTDDRMHKNSLQRFDLAAANTEKYVRAVAPDVTDWASYLYLEVDNACMECHALILGSGTPEQVSCESCHGPAEGYFEPHKQRDNYQAAVAAGLIDVVGKPETWAPICMDCHVLDDQALIDAGHPSGADFDLGEKYQPVASHFVESRNSYTAAQIGAIGGPLLAEIRSRLPDSAGGATGPVGTGGAEEAPEPAAPEPEPEPESTAEESAAEEPAEEEPAAEEPAAETPPATAATAAEEPGVPAPPPPPPPASTRSQPPVKAPVVTSSAGVVRSPDDVAPDVLPRTRVGVVAAIQGRIVTLLRQLLARNARAPVRVTPPERASAYGGADAELLRLQEEVIALALEALSQAPRRNDEDSGR